MARTGLAYLLGLRTLNYPYLTKGTLRPAWETGLRLQILRKEIDNNWFGCPCKLADELLQSALGG